MITREPFFTFGIEEEFHLVDRETCELALAPASLLSALQKLNGSQISPEFLCSQIEIGTMPLSSFKDAREELSRLRGLVVDVTRQHGLAPLASGTHPFAQTRGEYERTLAILVDAGIIGRAGAGTCLCHSRRKMGDLETSRFDRSMALFYARNASRPI
jgi:carboxylate-amine ligase